MSQFHPGLIQLQHVQHTAELRAARHRLAKAAGRGRVPGAHSRSGGAWRKLPRLRSADFPGDPSPTRLC